MYFDSNTHRLETKFHHFEPDLGLKNGNEICGYASVFNKVDQGGDRVKKGAYQKSITSFLQKGRKVKMLWQHDPTKPIGVWEEISEDKNGLYVKGHILPEIKIGSEALALVKAGAIDGLSIGYKLKSSERAGDGYRNLTEIELWEVSLVTFPMLPDARVKASYDCYSDLEKDLVDLFSDAQKTLSNWIDTQKNS